MPNAVTILNIGNPAREVKRTDAANFPQMRALLVLNRRSRLGLREGAAVYGMLEDAGISCVSDTRAPVDAVIAAGGDGTLIGAIPLALERHVPIGIVPLGTFNDLAKTLGVPATAAQACAALAQGRTRTIDLGRVNGCYFVNEASIGVTTRIARRQTPEIKQRFGVLGVISTALQTLPHIRAFSAHLSYDGHREHVRTVQITVANNAHFGGIFERIDASIDDGWLDLYSIEPRNLLDAVSLVRKIIVRDPSSGAGLRTRRAAQFRIATRHAHHISADGEPAGMTPALFEVLPKALRVLVP
ncbi:MAG TPA: YegS/Rv2252/BmrU family lipid kinase [Candidatus Baltobacteraceae bacterium]|nr:YegS/Rv2252/BmrU family lipid kinase [Candidatus Baltobacteraceae bacterium]